MLSVVYAAYAAAKIGAQVPGGLLVDWRGPDRVLRGALVLFTLSLIGFLFRTDSAFLRGAPGRGGAGHRTRVIPRSSRACCRGGESRARASGSDWWSASARAGCLAGPALGGALAHLGPRVPVAVASVAAVLVTLAAFAFRSSPEAEGESPCSEPVRARTLREELRFITGLAASLGFIGLTLPIAFNKLTFSAFQGLLPLYGPAQLGLGTRGVTALFALTGILLWGGAGPGRMARRPGRAATGGAGDDGAAAGGAGTGLAWAREVSVFSVAYATYICCSSIIFTATMKHAARVHGTDDTYGGVFGVLGTLTDLMTIVGPLLFLNVYGSNPHAVFPAMAVIGIAFAAGYVWLGRQGATRDPERASAGGLTG